MRKSPGWRRETSEAMSIAQLRGRNANGQGDPDPHGRLRPGNHRLFQIAEIHWRPAGETVRRPHRREIRLEHHGFRLSRRGHLVAGRTRATDAWLPVVELPDRPRARTRVRRSAVLVFKERDRARQRGWSTRQISRGEDREAGELPHSRLVRERLPPNLEQAAHCAL